MNQPSRPPSPRQKKKSVRIGPFELLDELGVGGAARVLRARYRPSADDAPLALERGAPVVLKVMRKEFEGAPDEAAAFGKEGELLGMLDHPGLVRLHSRGTNAGRMWLALEYIEGESVGTILTAFQQAQLRMKPDVAVTLIADLCEALSFAHSLTDPAGLRLGLCHSDLSPRNVLVDIKGQTHIIDFGEAFLSGKERPKANITGSPGYLAPEVAKGEPPSAASDVYQIGLILFELLTGRRAYPVEDLPDGAILEAHANGERAGWPANLQFPPDLIEIVDDALDEDPASRPPDATALYHQVVGQVRDIEAGRRKLAMIAQDLVRSNSDRPPALFV